MIDTATKLDNFLYLIKDETTLAIDTEFRWIDTYYPILCLIQIATKDTAVCIDVLAIKNLQPLFDKLYHQDILWVAHAARNDIEVLYRLSKKIPKKIFDTQISANFLQDLHVKAAQPNLQMSYQILTEILQGVSLEKAHTRTDWTARPLSKEVIKYALDDVYYLIKNYNCLKQQLTHENKLHWLMEECQSLLDVCLYEVDITQAWKRVKRLRHLPKKNHVAAIQLCAWRENAAQEQNKPRNWILPNDELLNVAIGKTHLNSNTQTSFESFIAQHPKLQYIKIDTTEKYTAITEAEKHQRNILQKLVQKKANQYNLSAGIVANNKTLLKYIRKNQSVSFFSGWRYQILRGEIKKMQNSLTPISAGNIPDEINVVIEIPANSSPVKYEVDKKTGAMFVDRFISTPMFYPCNYGFVPDTLAEDGDPADVLVITPYPLIHDAVITARPVGVLRMADEAGKDSKILAVPTDNLCKSYRNIKNIGDVDATLKDQIEHFFTYYKDLDEGKWVKIDGWEDVKEAKQELQNAFDNYHK